MFFHKATKTLLVTDLVVYVPSQPLDIIPVENLLDLARNDGLNAQIAGDLTPEEINARIIKGAVTDTPQNRRLGVMAFVFIVHLMPICDSRLGSYRAAGAVLSAIQFIRTQSVIRGSQGTMDGLSRYPFPRLQLHSKIVYRFRSPNRKGLAIQTDCTVSFGRSYQSEKWRSDSGISFFIRSSRPEASITDPIS